MIYVKIISARNRIFCIIKKDLKIFIADPLAIILLIGLPIVFISLFGYALSPVLKSNSFLDTIKVAIVDKENTAESRTLVDQFAGTEELADIISVLSMDEQEAIEAIENDEVAAAIIIPEGFTYSVTIGENKPFIVIGNKKRPLEAAQIKNYMQGIANLVSAAQSGVMTTYKYYTKLFPSEKFYEEEYSEVVMRFTLNAIGRNETFVHKQLSDIPDVTPYEYYTAGLLAVFLMFSALPGMKLMLNEKEMGISRRLAITPSKPWEKIVARFITSIALSFIQFSFTAIFSLIFLDAYWGKSLFRIILLFFASVFAATSWALLLSMLSNSLGSVDLLGNISILLMAFVGGSIYPLSKMPSLVRTASDFTIVRWISRGFLTVFSGDTNTSILTTVAVLFGMGLVLIVASAAIARLKSYSKGGGAI